MRRSGRAVDDSRRPTIQQKGGRTCPWTTAWFFLGFWFRYQLFEANFGLFGAKANGGGVAFFAHVGGFLFGVLVAYALTTAGRLAPQDGVAAPA